MKAAQINKRMIYHYFGDRDGLIGGALSAALHVALQSEQTDPVVKDILRTLYRDLDPGSEHVEIALREALCVLFINASLNRAKTESEDLLTSSEANRLGMVIAHSLFPDLLTQDRLKKPVYRLQSESKQTGSR